MKIRINIDNLKKAVDDVFPILRGNFSLPALENMLVTAADGSIVLTVNNLSIKVDKRLEGEVLTEGKALIHRDDLTLLLKMKNDVELDFAGSLCTVTGSRVFQFTVNENADEFPSMPEVPEGEPDFAIPESSLAYCLKLKKLIASVNRDNFRSLWVDGGNILACDGYRLAKIETQYLTSKRFMLPDFVLNYLAKALDRKSSELIVFYLSERGYIKVCSDKFEIAFKQYDGDFIAYENMFNTNDAKTVAMQKQTLAEAIGFMCDIGKSGGKKIKKEPVVYTFDGHTLTLVYKTAYRQVEEEIPYSCPDADMSLRIGFDPYYVNDLLSLVDGDRLIMSMGNPFSPSVMYGENEREKYLLLPVRLSDAA